MPIYDKSSLYKTSSMTFCREISSLGDTEGNVSTKLNFSVFSKFCFPIPDLQKLSILAKQCIETNLCRIYFSIFLVSIPLIRTMHYFGEKRENMEKCTVQTD